MNVHQSLTTAQPVAPLPSISLASGASDAMVRFEHVSKAYPAYRDKPSVDALARRSTSRSRAARSPA